VRPLSAQHKAYTRSAEEIWGQFSHNKITQAELDQGLAALENSYRRARIIGRVGRVVMVVGLILTVKDVAPPSGPLPGDLSSRSPPRCSAR
jgi:hypothetical protein